MEFENWVVLRTPSNFSGVDRDKMFGGHADLPSIQTESLPASAIADLERDPTTIAAAPDMPTLLIRPLAGGGSANTGGWGIAAVGADVSTYDGTGVDVAVLDTGIDVAHPCFAGMDIVQADFSGDGRGDHDGHGTHCAGTLFGQDSAGPRIGVARGIRRAFVAKVLNNAGKGTVLMASRGLEWAADQGAHVASMSLGFDVPGFVQELIGRGWPAKLAVARGLDGFRRNIRLLDKQIALLRERPAHGLGMLVVAATGNESERSARPDFRIPASLPAAADGVVAVGALEQSPSGLTIASFSNTLPAVCGPGVGIESAALGGGYVVESGTSMACPHVAGVAALWWQALGSAANAETVRAKLLGTANLAGLAPGYDHTDVGMGMVVAP